MKANQHPQLSRVFTHPEQQRPAADADRRSRVRARLDVPVSRIFSSLQTAFGGTRAGDFSINNRVYHVVMQNEMQWRERAEQISELFVRSNSGERVRLSNLVTITPGVGAPFLQQYNQFPSVSVSYSCGGRGEQQHRDAVMSEIRQRSCPPDTTMPGAACRNCGCVGPAIRRYGLCSAAVVMAWLSLSPSMRAGRPRRA